MNPTHPNWSAGCSIRRGVLKRLTCRGAVFVFMVAVVDALRLATEKNLKHRIPFDKKMFTKSENSFKSSHKPSKHKGFTRTIKARMTRKRARSQGKEHGSKLHWQRRSTPEDIQARRLKVAILWGIVAMKEG